MDANRRFEDAKRPRRWLTFAGALMAIVVGVAGAQAVSPGEHLSPSPASTAAPAAHTATPQKQHRWYQFGVASWYGHVFQGKPTASGQPYDENAMTCAHRTLPLGSLLRVTNLRNHRSVLVRVNDRGPMPDDRVIDLSKAAADSLGFEHRGVARVKIVLIAPPSEMAQLNRPDAPLAR